MTLSDLVIEQFPQLNPALIQHYPLSDIFTIAYQGTLIGYFNPNHNELKLDRTEVLRAIKQR